MGRKMFVADVNGSKVLDGIDATKSTKTMPIAVELDQRRANPDVNLTYDFVVFCRTNP